ncbi:MAG TPA: alpha/beta fold hydrolase [Stellaceae bacterium]|nr:alpha/beta fold hydrolase [Stellaceae bacterium]
MSLPNGWLASKAPDDQLAALAGEIRSGCPEAVAAALDRQLQHRAGAFLAGIDAYRHHRYRRAEPDLAILWQQGASRLLDYNPRGTGPAVLVVPSLINRYYILDLLPERSFARHLAAQGLRPLVLDWGEPGDAERDMTITDYITGPLARAIRAARKATGGPVALCGYCMGGLLALALALRQPADITCLALLATPWDFHAERKPQAQLLGALLESVPRFLPAGSAMPVSVIQSLFLALDPFLSERKFVRFAGYDPAGTAARDFVALEDWINDGVPLARNVALECAQSWYRDNDPGNGRWRIAEQPVRPQDLAVPALAVLPSRDRIVPPLSAQALASAIPQATVMPLPFGHIGMMASAQAPQAVWRPIAEWLRAQSA